MSPEYMAKLFFDTIEQTKRPSVARVWDELPTLERRIVSEVFAKILIAQQKERVGEVTEQIVIPYRQNYRGRVSIELTLENFEELQGILSRLGELDGKEFKFVTIT